MKSPARIGAGNGLHQFTDLVFQIFVGHDQRADGGAHIAAAGRNGLVDRGFQAVIVIGI